MTLDQRYWMWDVLLLLALAIALRTHQLGTRSFSGSEVGTALAARVSLHPENFQKQPLPNLKTGPYEWLVIQVTRLFGDMEEWSARLPAVLAGALTTMWIYLWGSHWFGAWVGRIAGFLFALWPWSVACGRMATGDGLLVFLSLLFAISVWKVLEGNLLGHPVAEPPLVAGRKPLAPARFLKVIPLILLGFLCLWITPSSIFMVLLFPVYLLIRLSWSWLRGKTADCEFKRTLLYLVAGAVYVMVAFAFVFWRDPGFFTFGASAQLSNLWPKTLHQSGLPELVMGGFLLAGTGMGAMYGRQGWLVILAAWLPLVGVVLLPLPENSVALAPAIPFVLLLMGFPLAWAFKVICESINHWMVERKHLTGRFVISATILVAGFLFVAWNVLLSPRSTVAVMSGSVPGRNEVWADWRAIAACLPQVSNREVVVTTDPLQCLYYLGHVDFLYPRPGSTGVDPITGIPMFPDGRALLDFIGSGHEVWIVGARSSFEETLKTREGVLLWNSLTQVPARLWEGPREIVICWRGDGR